MARRLHSLVTLLVLLIALSVAVLAQGPSDNNNNQPTPAPGTTPTTPPPGNNGNNGNGNNGNNVPTTPPPNGNGNNVPTTPPPNANTPQPTPSSKRPPTNGGDNAPDNSPSSDGNDSPSNTTPKPTKATKPPTGANPAATPATPPPAITTTAPEILIDRQAKSEYGTRAPPPSNETSVTANTKSEAAKTGAWLVPAVIGGVIIGALIVMTFFVRSRHSGRADEDYATPRRGSDNFMEHPKTTTAHHVAVPVLGDPVKDKVAADQSSMKAHGMASAFQSPRANRVASSPPLMTEARPASPGFGTYKQKPMEGSSVVF